MKLLKVLVGTSLVCATVGGGMGCSKGEPATEYVAGFSTQVQVPKEFKTLEYSVRAYSATDPVGVVTDCARVAVIDGKARLPKTLGVHKANTDAPAVMVNVVAYRAEEKAVADARGTDCESETGLGESDASGKNPLGARILRRSRQSYRNGRILYLPMPLKYACFDQKCPDDKVCVGGNCVDPQRDSHIFHDYSAELAFGDSSTCFSLARCLTDAVAPTLDDAATCTYSVPGSLEGMNVRAIFEGMVTEVLDVDVAAASIPGFAELSPEEKAAVEKDLAEHQEGYTITGPGKFRLAPGLCELTKTKDPKKKKILALAASRSCPPKPPEQPLCDENGDVLIPAPSKLLVLLDRSAPMAGILYSNDPTKDPVQLILSLSLDDAVFSTTQVGFKWLTDAAAGASACLPAPSFADRNALDVKFVPALQARDAIADLVGKDRSSPARAPVGSVENALSSGGVYDMLDKLDDKDKLNLRAVVILTNNPVGESCSSAKTGAIAAAAGEAFKKGILTYVIQLGQKGDDPTAPPANPPIKQADDASPLRIERVAQCEAVTTAAGRKENCFDDSRGKGGPAAEALGRIVSDLSSCLYDRPGSITDGSKTTLSILGQPDVVFNEACKDGAPVDGWNFAGAQQSLIRICGAPCETLRNNSRNIGTGKLASEFIAKVDPTIALPAAAPLPPVLFVTATQKKN